MKVVWLCNTLIGEIADDYGLVLAKPESWIKAFYEQAKNDSHIDLVYLFPYKDELSFKIHNVSFISYPKATSMKETLQIDFFRELIKKLKPDIIHIFGTEMVHSYNMTIACSLEKCINTLVVSIQGLINIYAKHYYAFMPWKEITHNSFRDICRNDTYFHGKHDFEFRGEYEKTIIKTANNVIGRTEWDEACVKQINNNIKYHFCNESLRESFYNSQKWDFNKCEKFSIFSSQSNYPIKGFHMLLEAMPEILKKYPQAHLYTTGESPLKKGFKEKLKSTSYANYLSRIIKRNNLEDKVTFLGYLDESAMCERFLNSNVFISPSSIENSPNSVGEAMILGVPTISSDVGGVKNMIKHGINGFLYPADENYMIQYYVDKIFSSPQKSSELSNNSIKSASIIHDKNVNYCTLINIYHDILKTCRK